MAAAIVVPVTASSPTGTVPVSAAPSAPSAVGTGTCAAGVPAAPESVIVDSGRLGTSIVRKSSTTTRPASGP